MQLGHYRDDKLFSFCHGETAAQFFREKCCCLREESCCMLTLCIELWCYIWYMERPTGGTRGAFGLLVSEDPLGNRDIFLKGLPSSDTALCLLLFAKIQRCFFFVLFIYFLKFYFDFISAVITTSGSERWCYPLKMLAVALESLWWGNVWVSEGTLWSAVTSKTMGQIWASISWNKSPLDHAHSY